jgi:hypothetical protein
MVAMNLIAGLHHAARRRRDFTALVEPFIERFSKQISQKAGQT